MIKKIRRQKRLNRPKGRVRLQKLISQAMIQANLRSYSLWSCPKAFRCSEKSTMSSPKVRKSRRPKAKIVLKEREKVKTGTLLTIGGYIKKIMSVLYKGLYGISVLYWTRNLWHLSTVKDRRYMI